MILQPGRNVWRIEKAARAAVLIDAAAYFAAVREALINARHSVFIIGWDIHSRTRLVGDSGRADDGFPEHLADFLSALVRRRPQLSICLLLWDYSVLYAMERELFPRLTLRWGTPPQVRLCLDDAVPIGSAQHQKLIVVDDAVAFTGGLDVTVRRWDTSAHRLSDPRRVDPDGRPYRPFHDVHAVVDGPAAGALAELARSRWALAACEDVPSGIGAADPWPSQVWPHFADVPIGIARTQPPYEDLDSVHEVERLFLDSIDIAETSIYIENQFLTSTRIAQQLAQRLHDRPQLEAVIVAPRHHDSWLEARTMRDGRIRFLRLLHERGVADRVRVLYPEVCEGHRAIDTMVHSKVMVVDDRLLRIGSANLNNRSMGTDTECDLVVEARAGEQRHAIERLRNRLIAEHTGTRAHDVDAAIVRTGSLVAAVEELAANGHCLRPIDDQDSGAPTEIAAYIRGVADPERPIGAEEFVGTMLGTPLTRRSRHAWWTLGLLAVVVITLTLSWRYTPLSQLAEPALVRDAMATFAAHPWALPSVVAIYVIGGLLAFPLIILIGATAAAFGPLQGIALAFAGALASAIVTYALGALLGRNAVRQVVGPRIERVRQRIVRQGVIAIAMIRLVPIAPYTVVNLVAGASEIRLWDYLLGTAIGLTPGILVMSALGAQFVRMLADPNPGDFALLAGAVLLWIVVAIGVNVLVSRLGSEKT